MGVSRTGALARRESGYSTTPEVFVRQLILPRPTASAARLQFPSQCQLPRGKEAFTGLLEQSGAI